MCLIDVKKIKRMEVTGYKIMVTSPYGLTARYGPHEKEFVYRPGLRYGSFYQELGRTRCSGYEPGFHAYKTLRDALLIGRYPAMQIESHIVIVRVTLHNVYASGLDDWCGTRNFPCWVGHYQTITKIYQPRELERYKNGI